MISDITVDVTATFPDDNDDSRISCRSSSDRISASKIPMSESGSLEVTACWASLMERFRILSRYLVLQSSDRYLGFDSLFNATASNPFISDASISSSKRGKLR